MNQAALVVGLAGLGIAFVRWARVAQREHYLPNSCFRIAWIWLRAKPVNFVIAIAGVAGAVIALFAHGTPAAIAAIIAGAAAAKFPFWLPLRGNGKPLKWTRRMTTLGAVTGAVLALVIVIVGLLASWWVAPAVAAILVTDGFELAIRITLPFEDRVARGFQKTAEQTLRQINPQIIAITGSYGKTTTKNHVRDLASSSASVAMSPASFNNRAGLSRTVNEHLPQGTELLVVEMGMYGPGEIHDLCQWVRPHIGVITAIGPMHLERVGSIQGIVSAKAEILEGVTTAVLWVSEPLLDELARSITDRKVVRCGIKDDPKVGTTLDVAIDPTPAGLDVWVGSNKIGSAPAGDGLHAANVGTAVGALLAAGFDMGRVGQSLTQLHAPQHRASLATDPRGVVVIDDTFNSNPDGARAALTRLNQAVSGRRVVVTPGMMELGALQDQANREFARQIADSGAELVIVGNTNRAALTAGVNGTGVTPRWFRDRKRAVAWVADELSAGDGVLWENDRPDHYP